MPATMKSRFLALAEPQSHDKQWLLDTLQLAIELELATIPPYLCAYWSITDRDNNGKKVKERLRHIYLEEMMHMGMAANVLKAIGGQPRMVRDAVASYPCQFPGHVHEGLQVQLGSMTEAQLDTFLAIERPEKQLDYPVRTTAPNAGARDSFKTIGEFYQAILDALSSLHAEGQISFSEAGQVEYDGYISKVLSLDDAQTAIKKIQQQGEGTTSEPTGDDPKKLAHFYAFNEIKKGGELEKVNGDWVYNRAGKPIHLPKVYELKGPASNDVSAEFDKMYSDMLRALDAAWRGDAANIQNAIDLMYPLAGPVRKLMSQGFWPLFEYRE